MRRAPSVLFRLGQPIFARRTGPGRRTVVNIGLRYPMRLVRRKVLMSYLIPSLQF
jgi:hypothetical protein